MATDKTAGAQQVGVLFFFCMLLSFSTMEAYGKWLSQSFPVLQVVWARYTFHFIFIVAVMAVQSGCWDEDHASTGVIARAHRSFVPCSSSA